MNNLKEINIKSRYCYYFDDIIKIKDLILILFCDISNKTLIGAKPLGIRFDKVIGFIRVYDGTTILVIIFLNFTMF